MSILKGTYHIACRTTLLLFLLALSAGILPASAKEIVRDSVEIHFRLNKSVLDPAFSNNQMRLDSLVSSMGDSVVRKVTSINVIGGASPEGSIELNNSLSRRRAASFIDYLDDYVAIPDSIVSFTFLGRDWNGLYNMVVADPNVPQKDKVMPLLNEIIAKKDYISDNEGRQYLLKLATIAKGKPYAYIYNKIFPALRKSMFVVEYRNPYFIYPRLQFDSDLSITTLAPLPEVGIIFAPDFRVATDLMQVALSPFYMSLKTNMLYDVLAIPNLNAEFYLGKNWSITGGGMYAWWSYDSRHRYWRIYGGDIAVRRWFGSAASRKPLTGHHFGLYAGVVTFDFEWGDKGYMGGLPKGTLLDRCLFHGGVEYGYSLPVAKRLNLDFSIGIGYFGGKYITYTPFSNIYHKEGEYKISYFGPTKAEMSLVWLLGRGNTNIKKGGLK